MARLLFCCLFTAITAMSAAPNAAACRIGFIAFEGTAFPNPLGPTWSGATGISFGEVTVVEAHRYFADAMGQSVPHADFTFTPSLSPNPVSPLWSFDDIRFTLSRTKLVFQNPTFLIIEGQGTVSGPGLRSP